jgi:hypothetical protein
LAPQRLAYTERCYFYGMVTLNIQEIIGQMATLLAESCDVLHQPATEGDRKAVILLESLNRKADEARRLIATDTNDEAIMLFALDAVPTPADLDAVDIDLDQYPDVARLLSEVDDLAAQLANHFVDSEDDAD